MTVEKLNKVIDEFTINLEKVKKEKYCNEDELWNDIKRLKAYVTNAYSNNIISLNLMKLMMNEIGNIYIKKGLEIDELETRD